MSKESKPRDRWQQVFTAAADRPNTWCKGCGYFRVVHGWHRADCTKTSEGAILSIEYRCEVCRAKPGQPCTNTINPGQPLPLGRIEHHARTLPPNDTRRRQKTNK